MKQLNKSSGFTLVELMVTLALITILTTLAVPSFRSTTHSTRMTAQVNNFASFLMLGRSEAVKRQRAVQIFSATLAADNEWGGGATMVDTNTLEVIAQLDPFYGNIAMDSDTNTTVITFLPRGYASPAVAGNFNVCETTSDRDGRQFMITATGKVILIARDFACP